MVGRITAFLRYLCPNPQNLMWQRGIKAADGMKVANQLTLIIQGLEVVLIIHSFTQVGSVQSQGSLKVEDGLDSTPREVAV